VCDSENQLFTVVVRFADDAEVAGDKPASNSNVKFLCNLALSTQIVTTCSSSSFQDLPVNTVTMKFNRRFLKHLVHTDNRNQSVKGNNIIVRCEALDRRCCGVLLTRSSHADNDLVTTATV